MFLKGNFVSPIDSTSAVSQDCQSVCILAQKSELNQTSSQRYRAEPEQIPVLIEPAIEAFFCFMEQTALIPPLRRH